MQEPQALFVINLLQDVSIMRPLVYLAARGLGLRTAFLASHHFLQRDTTGVWQREVNEIGEATGVPMLVFDNEMQALQLLQDKRGVLIAASETDLSAHKPVHDLFRYAPSTFIKVTLQHGFECPGFLHNRAHDVAHGKDIGFAADVLCGWSDGARLTSLAPSQRSKLYVSGPPLVLQPQRSVPRGHTGLVCENLHSVRLNVGGDFKTDFITMFGDFCGALARGGKRVTLRPHPAGQYVVKHGVALPPNAALNNNPIYKVDLAGYAYGISAPSSVLVDMVLAGIPVAVWRDPDGVMDVTNYRGLAQISTLEEWLAFDREARAHPERFLEQQRRFLEAQQMPLEPAEVHTRFATLFRSAARMHTVTGVVRAPGERVLFVTNNDEMSTLQLSFTKPLAPLVAAGEIATDLLTEAQMRRQFRSKMQDVHDTSVLRWLDNRFALFKPTAVVFSRYSGPHAQHMVERARASGIPVICHMDDDLLNVPAEIGLEKQQFHNEPARLATVRYLLDESDLVYASTPRLKDRFEILGAKAPIVAGRIYCSAGVLSPAVERPVRRIGYMGFDKASEFEMVLPALVAYLRRHPEVECQLFGFFPRPPQFDEFGERIRFLPPIRNYEDFLSEFAKLEWDIGICPLLPTAFNLLKADTKWVEYTAVGAAVIASRGTVYDDCCADGCGILVDTVDGWAAALDKLTRDPAARYSQVRCAQAKLEARYSTESLRAQVLDVIAQAKARRAGPVRAEAATAEARSLGRERQRVASS
jgi:hypothetical protein